MKISERGQVTIPKDIRLKYGFLPRMEVEFVQVENGVLIKKKVDRSPVDKVFGVLEKSEDTDGYIEEIRGR